MVSDFVLDKHVGHADTIAQTAVVESRFERNVFFICYMGSTMSLFYGWWWILTALGEERQKLKIRIAASADDGAAAENQDTIATAAAAADGAGGGINADGDGVGVGGSGGSGGLDVVDLNDSNSSINDGISVVVDAAGGGTGGRASSPSLRQRSPSDSSLKTRRSTPEGTGASGTFGELDERLVEDFDESDVDGTDHGNEVEEGGGEMPDKAKLRLMSRFGVLVQLYLLVVIVVMFVGALMFTPGSTFPSALRVVQDAFDIFFMFGLVHTFRLRTSNPYFMLSDLDYADQRGVGTTIGRLNTPGVAGAGAGGDAYSDGNGGGGSAQTTVTNTSFSVETEA